LIFFKDFSEAESYSDASRSPILNRPQWSYIQLQLCEDQWHVYSKSDQRVLEHAYKSWEPGAELANYIVHFSMGLQTSMDGEVYNVNRKMPKLDTSRRKYRSLAFHNGKFAHQIPIIDQCLSSSISTSISAVIDGIRNEGLLRGKSIQAEKAIELLKQIPESDIDLIGLRCMHLYTRDSFIHRALNTFLRKQDSTKVSTLGPFFKLLFSHFSKFPLKPQSLMVYRGAYLNPSQLRAYRRGTGKGSFHWLEFLSTSKSREAAKVHERNAFFIIRLQRLYNDGRAADISKLSQFEEEEEVLLRAGVEFSIDKYRYRYKNNKELYTFYLDAYI
jgi:hypothetical protein